MSTNLTKALKFFWNNQSDLDAFFEFKKLTEVEKICKMISDCTIYLFSSILGMNSLEKIALKKYSVDLRREYDEYVLKKTSFGIKNKSLILVFNGETDNPVSPESFERLERQSGFVVCFAQVKESNDILYNINYIKNSGNDIKAIWIRAHGSPQQIHFSQYKNGLDISPLNDFEKITNNQRIVTAKSTLEMINQQLDPDAPVILESCYTGQKLQDDKENIAEFISKIMKGRKIYAPSREALVIDNTVNYVAGKGFEVIINSFKEDEYFAKDSFLSRMRVIWLAFCNIQQNIAIEFQSKAIM